MRRAVQASFIATSVVASEVGPLERVITMLKDMKDTSVKDHHQEKQDMAALETQCADDQQRYTKESEYAAEDMAKYKGEMEDAQAKADAAAQRVAEESASIEAQSAKKTETLSNQASEKATWDATNTDYTESIEALKNARETLEKMQTDVTKKTANVNAALVQVSKAPVLAVDDKRRLKAMLQQSDSKLGDNVSGGAEFNYEDSSSPILSMFSELLQKFRTERREAEKSWMNTNAARDMTVQSLTDAIEMDTKEKQMQSNRQGKQTARAGNNKGLLAQSTAAKKENDSNFKKSVAMCTEEAELWVKRDKAYTDEQVAVDQAVEILSDDKTSTGTDHRNSFIQMKTSTMSPMEKSVNVVSFLFKSAKKQRSRSLALLAAELQDNKPFAKVISMIEDLLAKLKEQQTDGMTRNGEALAALNDNKIKRTEAKALVEKYTNNAADLTADIQQCSANIERLSEEIAESTEALAKRNALRLENNAINTKAVKDSEGGLEQLKAAEKVLKEAFGGLNVERQFEDDAKEAAGVYRGQQDKMGGVFGLLDVIISDLERTKADAEQSEMEQSTAFVDFKHETEKSIAVAKTNLTHQKTRRDDRSKSLSDAQADLESESKKLESEDKTFELLRTKYADVIEGTEYAKDGAYWSEASADGGFNQERADELNKMRADKYKARVTARKAEIESLKQALEMLGSEM